MEEERESQARVKEEEVGSWINVVPVDSVEKVEGRRRGRRKRRIR